MAFHDIATSFWSRAVDTGRQAISPQAESAAASHAVASNREECASAREPEWQGQWRVLKYF